MRVGMLTQWYDPEPGPAALPGVLARGLVARGHRVNVLTGFPNYPTGRIAPGHRQALRRDEHLDGVAVRRVALYPSHDASAPRRLLNYASFGVSAASAGVPALRAVDALWVNYSPITVGLAMWVAKAAYRVPVVVHVLDLWPDTVAAGGFGTSSRTGRIAYWTMSRWCDLMYRSAASVAYISPGVGELLERRGVPPHKLRHVPVWADEAIYHPAPDTLRTSLGLRDDQVVLLFAGTMGRAQGLSALVEACSRVRDDRFVCLLAGSGPCEGELRRQAHALGATNVRFLGRRPQEEMTELFGASDVSFVGLSDNALSRATMPSKVQASMAAGKALLVAAEGDAAEVVVASGAGCTARPEPDDIARVLHEVVLAGRTSLRDMGTRALEHYRLHLSSEQGVGRIESLLREAATGGDL